jgi:hypothetical protein
MWFFQTVGPYEMKMAKFIHNLYSSKVYNW